ncbi:MAG: hypothetical protein JWP88_1799, partial [Flaviaesturariibacter sp.]|nr:hypothetical protein [Flaviaesturariibacter sp.]
YKAQPLFLQKRYDDVIAIGNKILAQQKEGVAAQVYRMMAYSYMEKGDTATAKQYVDQLFEKGKKADLVAKDVTLKASIYSKSNPDQVVGIYLTAASDDTTRNNKILILQEAIDWAKKANKKVPEADLKLALFNIAGQNPAALFQIGLPYYQGGAYQRADSVFKAYIAAFPDSLYGHYWSAKSLAALDPTLEKGLAVPAYQKTLELAGLDKGRWKGPGVEAALYLAGYNNNVKKDKENAIVFLQKGLEFDPANGNLQAILKQLQTPAKSTPPVKKTSTSANSAKGLKK